MSSELHDLDELEIKQELNEYNTPDIHYTKSVSKSQYISPLSKSEKISADSAIESHCKLKCKPACKYDSSSESIPTPWPSIIVLIIGMCMVIYIGVAPGINPNRIALGITLILLWSILWALILWVMWKKKNYFCAWLLMVIPLILMLTFFLVVIIFDIGSY